MKTIYKVTTVLFIISLLMISFNINTCEAKTMAEIQSQARNFIQQGEGNSISDNGIFTELKSIAQVMTTVGIGILVLVTTYMGIKYMTSPPEAQAKLKQQLIGLLVATVVVAGASGIWNIVVSILEKIK